MAEEKIIDDEGHFHAKDEEVDLSGIIAEGWIALALFWALGLTVFYQFVTRYVMNDSAAWTEEVARYQLIGVVFIGAAMDNYLRAFDARSGKELWKGRLPAGGQATPMTYVWKGRQYVVIAAGGHSKSSTKRGDQVVAFALPD